MRIEARVTIGFFEMSKAPCAHGRVLLQMGMCQVGTKTTVGGTGPWLVTFVTFRCVYIAAGTADLAINSKFSNIRTSSQEVLRNPKTFLARELDDGY